MDRRGEIATFESEEEARKAGYLTRLSDADVEKLASINRHERRAYIARMRREQRKLRRKR